MDKRADGAAKELWVEKLTIPSNIYTPLGWISAIFHLAEKRTLVDMLNGTRGFFTLTEVRLPNQKEVVPFFALQRDAAYLIIAKPQDELLESRQPNMEANVRRISCMLSLGVVVGDISTVSNARVSDYLMHHTGFFVMRNCTSTLWQAKGESATPPVVPVALVNGHRVIGVADMSR